MALRKSRIALNLFDYVQYTCLERPPVYKDHILVAFWVVFPDRFHCTQKHLMNYKYVYCPFYPYTLEPLERPPKMQPKKVFQEGWSLIRANLKMVM